MNEGVRRIIKEEIGDLEKISLSKMALFAYRSGRTGGFYAVTFSEKRNRESDEALAAYILGSDPTSKIVFGVLSRPDIKKMTLDSVTAHMIDTGPENLRLILIQ